MKASTDHFQIQMLKSKSFLFAEEKSFVLFLLKQNQKSFLCYREL